MGKNNESIQFDSGKGKAYLLHELRHVWQLNNPEWKEKYAKKDIDIEVDSFEIQLRFEELMGIKNDEREIFKYLEEYAIKHKINPMRFKARFLWEQKKYNNPALKYTNRYNFK